MRRGAEDGFSLGRALDPPPAKRELALPPRETGEAGQTREDEAEGIRRPFAAGLKGSRRSAP